MSQRAFEALQLGQIAHQSVECQIAGVEPKRQRRRRRGQVQVELARYLGAGERRRERRSHPASVGAQRQLRILNRDGQPEAAAHSQVQLEVRRHQLAKRQRLPRLRVVRRVG